MLLLNYCIPRTKYVRGILWFSRRYAASADTSSFSQLLKKSLSDCYHILYIDIGERIAAWEARWALSDYLWATQGLPNSQKFTFLAPLCHLAAELFKCRLVRDDDGVNFKGGGGPISETLQ